MLCGVLSRKGDMQLNILHQLLSHICLPGVIMLEQMQQTVRHCATSLNCATLSRLQIENEIGVLYQADTLMLVFKQIIALLFIFTCCKHTKTPAKVLGMLKWESVFQLMLSFGTETGWIKMTENLVPCHPRHNAVSSISGCPSCDHAVLSFQSHVTLSTLLYPANWKSNSNTAHCQQRYFLPQPLSRGTKINKGAP